MFEHITENDFAVRLVGGSIKVLGAAAYDDYHDDDADGVDGGRQRRRQRRRRRRLGALENVVRSRYLVQTNGSYDEETDAGVDVLFSTVALPAFYSSLPSTVGLLDDNFEVMEEVRASQSPPSVKENVTKPSLQPAVWNDFIRRRRFCSVCDTCPRQPHGREREEREGQRKEGKTRAHEK